MSNTQGFSRFDTKKTSLSQGYIIQMKHASSP